MLRHIMICLQKNIAEGQAALEVYSDQKIQLIIQFAFWTLFENTLKIMFFYFSNYASRLLFVRAGGWSLKYLHTSTAKLSNS